MSVKRHAQIRPKSGYLAGVTSVEEHSKDGRSFIARIIETGKWMVCFDSFITSNSLRTRKEARALIHLCKSNPEVVEVYKVMNS